VRSSRSSNPTLPSSSPWFTFTPHALRVAVLEAAYADVLCVLIAFHQPVTQIRRLIVKHRIQHANYEGLISRLFKNQALIDDAQPGMLAPCTSA
jgi:hypothetical protein